MDAFLGDRWEVLDRDGCLELLGTRTIGRLGLSIEALPAILPVRFAMLGDRIVVRTVPGTKLDAAVTQSVVAFEVDDHDADGSWGWSVLVRGRGSEITEATELARAEALPMRVWAFRDRVADRFLSIETSLVTGRRFGDPGSD